jgi:plasmid stabilization system protein ParE
LGRVARRASETAACLKIIWKGSAESDLLQIFADLEDFSEDAGAGFVQKLDFTLENLRAHPKIAPMFEDPVRRLVIGSTGYGLFYSVETRGIVVHALIHLSRDPKIIRERIRRLLRFE